MSLIDDFHIISIEHKFNSSKSINNLSLKEIKKKTPFIINENEKKLSNFQESTKNNSIINKTLNKITSSISSFKDYIIYNDSLNILSQPIDL